MSQAPLSRPDRDDDRAEVVVPLARAPIPDGPRQTETSTATRHTLDRHWIALSLFCHVLILAVLLFGLPAIAPLPPVHVLKITLVPRGPGGTGATRGHGGSGTADTMASGAAATPQTPPQPPAPAEVPPPAPEPVAPPAPPTPEMPPPTPPQPEIPPPAPEPATTPPPPTPEIPPPQAVAVLPMPPPPKPRHIPPRHRVIRPPARPRIAETPAANPAPVPAPAAPAAPAKTGLAAAAPSPGAGSGPGAEAGQGKGAAGAGKGAIGNGVGPGDDYLEALYRHLLRYKKYPPEAISRKQQGKVVIGFTIARDGTVSDAHIEKSSGYPAIDRATLDLVKRASPVPPLPASFRGDTARVKFPIDYRLSLIDQMF